ncbi:MAG: regulatory protein RecX [Candidatus Omnitrophica bacterium]|nr:regulatory protein RecX [Candidatus Omnitrophota bacterium]
MDNREEEDYFSKAQNTVCRLLKFRLRSEKELQDKLKAKNLPGSVIKQTIQHLKDIGLVDDLPFARQWVCSRLKKPFGINRIRLELKLKGVDPAAIETVIQETTGQYDELDVVTRLAQRQASKYKNIDHEKIRQRVYGYLQRRGFSTNVILKAIKTL